MARLKYDTSYNSYAAPIRRKMIINKILLQPFEEQQYESNFLSNAPDICMSIAFFEHFLSSPLCPSDDEDI